MNIHGACYLVCSNVYIAAAMGTPEQMLPLMIFSAVFLVLSVWANVREDKP